jgi:hypothetical protein
MMKVPFRSAATTALEPFMKCMPILHRHRVMHVLTLRSLMNDCLRQQEARLPELTVCGEAALPILAGDN